jgi:uncharacterized protein (DUF4415 family)
VSCVCVRFDRTRCEISDHTVSRLPKCIEAFDWEQAIIEKDERRDYAEERYRALGYISEDFARARPAKDVLPPGLYQAAVKRYRGQRGPQKAPVKQDIKLRIDPDIVASFKATGPGSQSRMNDALRRALPDLTSSRKNPKADQSRIARSPTKH